ncbi:hypothetical protein C8J56DRAFT_832553, partial [Mycena floridula]
MAPGFLAVFSEPGELVSLEEFQDWYNNEHVPLRLDNLPSFLTGARYSASDALKPTWAALYDVDDTATFEHESYTRLRANRSPREANLVKRLELLDRRTCEFMADSGESSLTTSMKLGNPTSVIVSHGLVTEDEESAFKWFDAAVGELKGVPGWVRTRFFRCFDSLKGGVGVPSGPEAQLVPKYLVIHGRSFLSVSGISNHVPELLDTQAASSAALEAILKPKPSFTATEVRRWDLYRAYPSIAQGNV